MLLIFVFYLTVNSCSSTKTTLKNNKKKTLKTDKIITNALQYKDVIPI